MSLTPTQTRARLRELRKIQDDLFNQARQLQALINETRRELPDYEPYGSMSTMEAIEALVDVHTVVNGLVMEVKLDVRTIAVDGKCKLRYIQAWKALRYLCGRSA